MHKQLSEMTGRKATYNIVYLKSTEKENDNGEGVHCREVDRNRNELFGED